MKRDPRVYPRPGDVVRQFRSAHDRTVVKVTPKSVVFTVCGSRFCVRLSTWHRECAIALVVTVAGEEGSDGN